MTPKPQGDLFTPAAPPIDESMRAIADAIQTQLRYPHTPGFKEPTTSKEAATLVHTPDVVRARVFDAIEAKESTADEVAKALDIDRLTVRPRVSELRADGKIVDTGLRRANDSGRRAIVWRVRRG